MSVEVKTPTKTQFEHAEFPCGEKKPGIPTVTVTGSGGGPPVAAHQTQRPIFQRQASEYLGNKYSRKRRFSERAGGADNRERYVGAPGFKRNRFARGGNRGNFYNGQEKMVLPTKFFLGGNINDPLNLNSLSDEKINRALNENTPKSSPMAVPRHRQEVHVIIPANIQDPLGLTSGEDLLLLSPKSAGKKRQRKNKHKKRNQGDKSDVTDPTLEGSQFSLLTDSKDYSKPMHIDITSDSEVNYSQHNLSTEGGLAASSSDPPHTPSAEPGAASNITSSGDAGGHAKRNDSTSSSTGTVVPQLMSPKCKRRKRNSSECKSDGSQSARASVDSEKSANLDKNRPKNLKRQHSHCSSTQSGPFTPPPNRSSKPKPRGRKHGKQFIYGNYNRYYGYRNPDGSETDSRLENFNRTWFEDKDVLDIGCNVGHVTLGIAKDLGPRKVVGMDIDGTLVSAAKRNVRHYLTTKVAKTSKYPASMVASFGPIAAPPVGESGDAFPNNVMFLTGNYVLESDELVDMTREEYDVILALSVTKWVHLNWGDAGLKRMFRRMFKHLRPGGKLILEPQLWPSYKKRKKITEAHSMNYSQIQLRPEQFREYLLREIGFSKCEGLEVPFNKAKGFQRPLLVFSKSDTTQPGSRVTTPGSCSRGATPRFHLGWSATTSPATFDGMSSNPATPGYIDSPRCAEKYTPRTELLEAVEEESLIATPPIGESTPIGSGHRPLSSLRANSAPCLLETTLSGMNTSVDSACVAEQKTSVLTKIVEFVVGQTKESVDGQTKESVDEKMESVDGQLKESVDEKMESVDEKTKESVEEKMESAEEKMESVDEKTKESVDEKMESVDGQNKESVDEKMKESVDGENKESVDGQTKESVDGQTKESVDEKTKESVDEKTKESAEVDGQKDHGAKSDSTKAIDDNCGQNDLGVSSSDIRHKDGGSLDDTNNGSSNQQLGHSTDAQVRDTTTATSSSPEPGSKDHVESTNPSRSDEKTLTGTDEKTLTGTNTRDCHPEGTSK